MNDQNNKWVDKEIKITPRNIIKAWLTNLGINCGCAIISLILVIIIGILLLFNMMNSIHIPGT